MNLTANTALKLGAYFGNTPDFWLGIQNEFDLRKQKMKLETELKKRKLY